MVILTDQQRHNAVGFRNPKIQTPNIDKLARNGVVCPTTVVQSPQCQPSRASILTGRYPTTLKMWWNEIPLDRNEKTIGNYLEKSGYQTGYFGKFHVDGIGGYTAVAKYFGFKESYLSEDWQQFLTSEHWEVVQRGPNRVRAEFFDPMQKEPWVGRFTDRQLHHEDVVTYKAVDFMRRAEQPFFCMVGFNGPHPPYAAPDPFNDLYDPVSFDVPEKLLPTYSGVKMTVELWQNLKAQYYGLITWIDDNVGQLIKAAGEDTIIVFTSDHGDILGDHGLFSKGLYAYEGNILVPLVIRFPGKKSVEYPHIVQSIDILPTLLEALGVKRSPAIQGQSLFSAFWEKRLVNHWALSMIGHGERLRMIRTPKAKYWYYAGREYLFDLKRDPAELKNLAAVGGSELQDLRFLLMQGLIRSEDMLPFPKSI